MENYAEIEVIMSEETAHLMEARRITIEDIKKTIFHAEKVSQKFVHPTTGHFLAGVRPYFVTFWVAYAKTKAGYEVYTGYSHRVKITGTEQQSRHLDHIEDFVWKCFKCDQFLSMGSAQVDYLGNELTTDLPMCPSCMMVLISEPLAMGKVADVEKILEDK